MQTATDEAGNIRALTKDELNRLILVTEAGSAGTSYAYDVLDNLNRHRRQIRAFKK